MTTRRIILILLPFVAGIMCGCGNSPATVFQEGMVLRNEAADAMRMSYDEKSAEKMVSIRIEKLKKKFENLKERSVKVFDNLGPIEKKEAAMLFVLVIDEYLESQLRFSKEEARLKEIVNQIEAEGGDTRNLKIIAQAGRMFGFQALWQANPFLQGDVGQGGGGFPGGPGDPAGFGPGGGGGVPGGAPPGPGG